MWFAAPSTGPTCTSLFVLSRHWISHGRPLGCLCTGACAGQGSDRVLADCIGPLIAWQQTRLLHLPATSSCGTQLLGWLVLAVMLPYLACWKAPSLFVKFSCTTCLQLLQSLCEMASKSLIVVANSQASWVNPADNTESLALLGSNASLAYVRQQSFEMFAASALCCIFLPSWISYDKHDALRRHSCTAEAAEVCLGSGSCSG